MRGHSVDNSQMGALAVQRLVAVATLAGSPDVRNCQVLVAGLQLHDSFRSHSDRVTESRLLLKISCEGSEVIPEHQHFAIQ